MSVKTTTLTTAVLLSLAATALCATETSQPEVRHHLTALVAEEGGDLTWRPAVHGLNKYTIVLPKTGISQAIRYQDTSDLFYLSEISESAFKISSNDRLWANLSLTPTWRSLNLNWPLSEISYGGLQLNHDAGKKISPSLTGHIIVSSTPYSFHDVELSIGDKIELTASGAILNMGETKEQFYFASVFASQKDKYSISYGQRTWDIFGEFDTAWVAGVNGGDPFASVQLESKLKNGFWFMQLSSKSGNRPQFSLGAQYNLKISHAGSWSIIAATNKDSLFAPRGPTLGTHRRVNLPSLWRPAVSIEAISSVRQIHQ